MEKFEISFAKENEFREIVNKLDLYFDKFPGYFESLVPVLYKKGKNTHENHIVVKCDNEIVGMIAVKENVVYIGKEEYRFCLLGSLAVDFNYRNKGIMGMLFDFILNKYSYCDFLGLSGKFDRYKRFGFYPSEKIYSYLFEFKNRLRRYNFKLITDENVDLCKLLHEKKEYKVYRENIIDNLYMWEYKPYVILENDKELGYLIYNHRDNIVEEILLFDNNLVNDVMCDFSVFLGFNTSLKINLANRYLSDYIDSNVECSEFVERTLYKINNPSLKGVYIPRSDLI